MKKIINQKTVLDNVIGTHAHHLCKTVVDKTTGYIYASVADTAEALGAHPTTVSQCCNGMLNTCKGHRLEFIKHASENVPSLVNEIRNRNDELRKKDDENEKLKAENAKLRAERDSEKELANQMRAIIAEREAKQKAERERLELIEHTKQAIQNAKDEQMRRERIVEQKEAEVQRAVADVMESEAKVKELTMKLLKLEGKMKED